MQWVDPESVFAAVAPTCDRVFWLDGGGGRDWSGRRSYIGWLEPGETSLTYEASTRTVREHDGHTSRVVDNDIFTALDRRCTGGTTNGGHYGWVGYLGYACRPDLPARTAPTSPDARCVQAAPDAVWMQVSRYAVFDHGARTVRLHGISGLPPGEASEVVSHTARTRPLVLRGPSYQDYCTAFARVQDQLAAGNTYQTNLTYRLAVDSYADPVAVYRRLRRLNPAPYSAFVAHQGVSVLSSSPERFVTIDDDRTIETRPIKGTTRRSADPHEDARSRDSLLTDPRFRAENLIVVDLLRNDLSQVCEVGSVVVPDLMHVDSYPSVHQLVTTIRGRLRPGISGVRAVEALFPGGSMTGAPKLRTMRIISEVETTARGVYSGALGWLGNDGRADLGIIIRTLVHRDSTYTMGTGGGVTVRSDPATEFAESRWKAERLLDALAGTTGSLPGR